MWNIIMTRKNAVFHFAVVLIAVTAVTCRRNVIVIVGDDAGRICSVYQNEYPQDVCKNPNLKKLASEGVVFTNAYTTVSSCSPRYNRNKKLSFPRETYSSAQKLNLDDLILPKDLAVMLKGKYWENMRASFNYSATCCWVRKYGCKPFFEKIANLRLVQPFLHLLLEFKGSAAEIRLSTPILRTAGHNLPVVREAANGPSMLSTSRRLKYLKYRRRELSWTARKPIISSPGVFNRSTILSGLPSHQNGMYGLEHSVHHFSSLDRVKSLPNVLREHGIFTGIIGKKHVGPRKVYNFDFEETEERHSIMQVGRNITRIRLLARKFLKKAKKLDKPFFLYMGLHDPHRCGRVNSKYGPFCEKFGDGSPGMGKIPDWDPVRYNYTNLGTIPPFVPETEEALKDLAAFYTTISRMDQGVGLILRETEMAGFLGDTMVIFTSDNGPPFPDGRTNLYEPGVQIPMVLRLPTKLQKQLKESTIKTAVTLLDVFPTILDWFGVPKPVYSLRKHGKPVEYTGESLLSLLPLRYSGHKPIERRPVFLSHSLHEVTMFYPMRGVRVGDHKIVHNMNWLMPFAIDQDFYMSPTFQGILNRTVNNSSLHWHKTLQEYYYRPRWEYFRIESFEEVKEPINKTVLKDLLHQLQAWQWRTEDPWVCYPDKVLEGGTPEEPVQKCLPLHNSLVNV